MILPQSTSRSRLCCIARSSPLSVPRLHADQPSVDAALVHRLIASQHPQWAGLPIERVASDGTTNAIYRLGPAVAVRLPLVRYGERAIDVEGRWLPQLGPRLPLAVPEQLATGDPEGDFPVRWSVHRWIEGEPVSRATIEDLATLAKDLAARLRWHNPATVADVLAELRAEGFTDPDLATRIDATPEGR